MLTSSTLRDLGPDGLTALLRRRPDVLWPVPPKSMAEVVARLTHPVNVRLALERLDLPTLQVAEVLAALGDGAERAGLDAWLRVGPDDPRAEAVTRAVAALRDRWLVDGGCRVLPGVRAVWSAPLGLDADLRTLAASCTVDDLRAVLGHLGAPRALGRKAELIASLVTWLGDQDRVRQMVAAAPPGVAEQLLDVAHGRRRLQYYRWYSPRQHRAASQSEDPLDWALARFLLVRQDWKPVLQMPAEVALALRGPDWAAPFTPSTPALAWTAVPREMVDQAAVAAAGQALRSMSALLTAAGEQPIPLLKSHAVGVRELRRLAGLAGCGMGPLRFTLALAYVIDLLDLTEDGLVPTVASDAWQRQPAPERLVDLARHWQTLDMSPLAEPGAAWAPQPSRRAEPLRRAVLDLLAEHPDAAPGPPELLAAAVRWRLPRLLAGDDLAGDDVAGDDVAGDDVAGDDVDEGRGTGRAANAGAEDAGSPAAVAVRAVLAEAAWLGLTGAGALSAAGRATHAGGNVAAVLRDALGAAQVRARLQTDLTAVVLGEPSPDLAAALDQMADRESRSAATTWRFSPGSIRRAMDAGTGEDELLRTLQQLADGAVPQPLEYLVHDVARRHGVLRGGRVNCYLRAVDEALLAEIVADRKLVKLRLRRVAPTVVVGARPLAETLAALRAASYAPVEEGPDGEPVVVRAQRHRAPGSLPVRSAPDAGTPDARTPDVVPDAVPDVVPEVVAALLGGVDEPRVKLVDLGNCVVDPRSLPGIVDEVFVQGALRL